MVMLGMGVGVFEHFVVAIQELSLCRPLHQVVTLWQAYVTRQQKRRALFGIVKLCPIAVLGGARLDRKPELLLQAALHNGRAELGDERRVRG